MPEEDKADININQPTRSKTVGDKSELSKVVARYDRHQRLINVRTLGNGFFKQYIRLIVLNLLKINKLKLLKNHTPIVLQLHANFFIIINQHIMLA